MRPALRGRARSRKLHGRGQPGVHVAGHGFAAQKRARQQRKWQPKFFNKMRSLSASAKSYGYQIMFWRFACQGAPALVRQLHNSGSKRKYVAVSPKSSSGREGKPNPKDC